MTYSYEKTLHQLVKVLLVRSGRAEEATVDRWNVVEVTVDPDELRRADDYVLSVHVADHLDPATRRVTALVRRGELEPPPRVGDGNTEEQ